MEENNTTFRRSNSRLSMLDKSLERRRVNKEHNSNFRAGYVAVHEEHLHKTGLRGRKRFLAYFLLFLIYAVAVANLVLTVLIVLALRIDQNGSDVMEFLGEGGVKYKTEVKAEMVLSDTGEFGGYKGQDLEIHGDGQPVVLQHMIGHGSSVEFSGENTTLRSQEGLHVIDPLTGNTILHTANDSGIPSPTGMKQLNTTQVVTSKVVPNIVDDLRITTDQVLTIQGNEGLTIGAEAIEMSGSSIFLNALNTLSLEGGPGGGVYINTTSLPRKSTASTRSTGMGLTLCVCGGTGRVFQVTAPPGLSHPCGKLRTNPCL
ncbi:beta-sarcoglycan-like [Lytechinus variegatus]|uniref:beta-sarcoglycan-like n=1 Tax=Lytechinus variegatus TaxID=7654 RepID=UPI001BB181C0|nr:beta-sarcoglycan-like [Lytechinus variegatus]